MSSWVWEFVSCGSEGLEATLAGAWRGALPELLERGEPSSPAEGSHGMAQGGSCEVPKQWWLGEV